MRITWPFDADVPDIAPETIESLAWELDLGNWEMNRTHWAVKNVDLLAVLNKGPDKGASVPPYIAPASSKLLGDKVFIVHGRNDAVKYEVARFLEQIGIEAVILHERPNGGRTLITKFQEESAGIRFAVVVMTPDDRGGMAGEAQKARARQMIFELGFFIGNLGPERSARSSRGISRSPQILTPSSIFGSERILHGRSSSRASCDTPA
ncbi:nucleotide-binding protein [Pendulispora brunnea]|uniref:Nucleotide-binding protein n=1 Tax=Pendulispora brunnea TaxID=2905690 RepID=A0ABZ2K212_9BACT